MISLRVEDLKEELDHLQERICIKLRQGITEGVLNSFLSEGDELVDQIKREFGDTSQMSKREMYTRFSKLHNDWNSFKFNCKSNPASLIGGPSVTVDIAGASGSLDPEIAAGHFDAKMTLAKGITILEKTSQSLHRASQAAREAEEIGTNTLTELGGQRESLLRTRGRLDETNQNLRKTHLILRTLHRRVLTNKLLLYLIILFEILIGVLLVYKKWSKKSQ